MPIEKNPKTGTGIYYPPCGPEALYAYHGISGRVDPEKYDSRFVHGPQQLIATEEAFRTIWQQGAVYSSVRRESMGIVGQSSMIFGMDRAAGDDDFVFLNVCVPHSAGERGYHLVFDPYKLVAEGAIVGLDDLQGSYMQVAQNLGIENWNNDSTWSPEQLDDFEKLAEKIQQAWRLEGQDAGFWLEWIQGLVSAYPINLEPIYAIDEYIGGRHESIIKWMSESRKSAVSYAELLVPDELPLEWLVGVIFRKNWVPIEDFIQEYGPPGTEPPPAPEFHEAHQIEGSTGHPAKCPRCGDWIGLTTLEVPGWGSSVFRDSMRLKGSDDNDDVMNLIVCLSCGAAFRMHGFGDNSFSAEEYVGHIDDFEYKPLGW